MSDETGYVIAHAVIVAALGLLVLEAAVDNRRTTTPREAIAIVLRILAVVVLSTFVWLRVFLG